jgi:lysophospholipase L1-like esterase
MANQTINSKLKVRSDSGSNWASSDLILLSGEPGYDSTNRALKFGDGTNTWASLPDIRYTATEILTKLKTVDGAGSGLDAALLTGASLSTDGTFAANSDTLIPSQKAIKTFIDAEAETARATLYDKVTRSNIFACIGDSITNGHGGYPYPTFMAFKQGIVVRKYAVGGYTIQNAIDNLLPQMFAVSPLPCYAITLIGINDMFGGRTNAQMRVDYANMINLIAAKGITPIICSLVANEPYWNALILPFNDWLKDYALSNGFIYIDTYTPFIDANGAAKQYYLFDGTHPTTLGYYTLANTIYEKLPLVSTDYPAVIAGGENLLLNPYFVDDVNADGIANSWNATSTGGGCVGSYALIDHPLIGKWQEISITGGTNNDAYVWLRQINITEFSVGDKMELSIDIDGEDGLSSTTRVMVMVFLRTGTNFITQIDLTKQGTTYDSMPPKTDAAEMVLPFKSERIKTVFTVPAGIDNMQVALGVYGSGTGKARFGRAVLKHATT